MEILRTQWFNDNWTRPLDSVFDSEQTLVLSFGSSDLFQKKEPFKQLQRVFSDAIHMGCSTAGEIFGTEVNDDTLSVVVVKFAKTRIKKVFMPIQNVKASYDTGKELAGELVDGELRAIFILSEGLTINGTKLIQGVNDAVGKDIVVSGGLAGDGSRFERTWIITEKFPEVNAVSMLGFYGSNVEIRTGSVGGWDVFGPERVITRSSENILYELDNKPALQLYKEYLGKKADKLPGSALLFPLTLKSKFMDREGVVRTVLSVDEEKGSLTFAGDMPEGSSAQLMHANFERLIDGASTAANLASFADDERDHPVLSIAISCVGRRLVLGERIEDETEAVLEVLPPTTVQIGFYSYGEISSGKLGTCDLHNQTMTLTTIREK